MASDRDPRGFPVLVPWRFEPGYDGPKRIPWHVMDRDSVAIRAKLNHSQTIDRLAERGGLSPAELWAAFHDKSWREAPDESTALEWLRTFEARLWAAP